MSETQAGGTVGYATEDVCIDCMEGDHAYCDRQAGYMHDDTPERCGCHMSGHHLDNRQPNG